MRWSPYFMCAALLTASGCAETKSACHQRHVAKAAAAVPGTETVVCRCGDCIPPEARAK